MKKIICLLLAFGMLAAVLISCAPTGEHKTPDGGGKDSGTLSEPPQADSLPENIDLIVNGSVQYYIVCQNVSEHGAAAEYVINDIRRKTGVVLELAAENKENSSLHKIVVGGDYAELFPNAEVKLTYEGYAAVWLDGDIYLCGYTTDTSLKAAKKWLSSIPTKECVTKDENGAVTMRVPTSLLYVFNPEYTVKDPVLLSAHVSEYCIVYDEDGRYTTQLLAKQLAEQIARMTGFLPNIVSDATAAKSHEILCGTTNRKAVESIASDTYSVISEQDRLCLNFGSAMAFDGILSGVRNWFGKETLNNSGSISSGSNVIKSESEIRIMTSNVLFGTDKVPASGSGAQLSNQERGTLLGELYLDLKPDFVGLQEAGGYIGEVIRDTVAAEYAMVSQSDQGMTPILYRTDTWKIAKDNNTPIQKMQMFDGNWCWDYEWVMFENLADPTVKVIVMNLHFHPDMSGYRDKRPADMDTFNAEVRRLEQQYPTVPMFVTGDYNTSVSHPRGDLQDGWAEDVIAGTKLQCGAQLTENSADKAGNLIDHICTNAELVNVVRHCGVSYEAMKQTSDHIPYFIDVTLKK